MGDDGQKMIRLDSQDGCSRRFIAQRCSDRFQPVSVAGSSEQSVHISWFGDYIALLWHPHRCLTVPAAVLVLRLAQTDGVIRSAAEFLSDVTSALGRVVWAPQPTRAWQFGFHTTITIHLPRGRTCIGGNLLWTCSSATTRP